MSIKIKGKKQKVFLIKARTGCTCCSEQNHYRGLFKSEKDALRRISYYKAEDSNFWPLASQYARRGVYTVEEVWIEYLDSERVIIAERVFDSNFLNFINVKEDGTVEDDNSEYVCHYDHITIY